jgi:phosphoglycolate phosphatase
VLLQEGSPRTVFVFDLDGTLVDTAPTTIKVLNEMVLERGGKTVEVNDLSAFLSTGGQDIVGAVLGSVSTDLVNDVSEFRARLSNVRVPESDIYPGITELLLRLREHQSRLAVCTNKPQDLAVKTLYDVGLIGFFEIIVGSRKSHKNKPTVEMLNLIQSELECMKSEMTIIGDSEIDQEMAHNAGVAYVHLNHGYGSVNADITMPIQVFSLVDSMVYDFLIARD